MKLYRDIWHGKRERGDTIIEVIIAIGIVSLVLTAAYAITNRNTQVTQEVQEQSYAQKLVEEQVEVFRSLGTSAIGSDITAIKSNSGGCFDGGAYVSEASGASLCKVTNGGATYLLTVDSTNAPVYKINAHWDTLGGSGADVSVLYRVE